MILGDDEASTEIRTQEEKTGKVDHKPQKYSTLGSNHNRLNMDNADMECDAMANMGTRHCMGLVREGERYAKLRPYLEISESIIYITTYSVLRTYQ